MVTLGVMDGRIGTELAARGVTRAVRKHGRMGRSAPFFSSLVALALVTSGCSRRRELEFEHQPACPSGYRASDDLLFQLERRSETVTAVWPQRRYPYAGGAGPVRFKIGTCVGSPTENDCKWLVDQDVEVREAGDHLVLTVPPFALPCQPLFGRAVDGGTGDAGVR